MVNDIDKLKDAIGSLEAQAKEVSQFSGLLKAVDYARSQIETSQIAFGEASTIYMKQVRESSSKIDNLLDRTEQLPKSLVKIESSQKDISTAISSLKYVTADQYKAGITDLTNEMKKSVDSVNAAMVRMESLLGSSNKKNAITILICSIAVASVTALLFKGII
jgi:predicted  nucleic acid-binding Zn-ribbon protein